MPLDEPDQGEDEREREEEEEEDLRHHRVAHATDRELRRRRQLRDALLRRLFERARHFCTRGTALAWCEKMRCASHNPHITDKTKEQSQNISLGPS